MTNKEIYDVSGGSYDFNFSAIDDNEKLVHWIIDGGGLMRAENPNGSKFYAGTFPSDRNAFDIIEGVRKSVMSGGDDDALKKLCVKLEKSLPIIDGIKYVMTLEQAYYLARTHRPMDDIYFVEDVSTEEVYDVRFVEYVSGRYAS